MAAATLEVLPEGVRLSPTFVFGAPRLELNGSEPIVDGTGLIARSQFLPGRNRVTYRLDGHPSWEATVVLADTPLSPRVMAPLVLQRPFTVSWTEAPWATSSRVELWPIDAPWTRAVYPSFEATGSSLTATFPGFPDGRGGVVTGTRASLQLTSSRVDGRFTLAHIERLEVPIAP